MDKGEQQKNLPSMAAEGARPGQEEKYVNWFLKRWHLFVLPFVLLIIVFVVLGLRQSRMRSLETNAYAALNKAKTVAEYVEVHNEYPKTLAGMIALKQGADDLFKEGNFSESRGLYQKYLEAYPEGFLAPWIQNHIACTYESEGSYDKAIEAYKTVQNNYPEEISYLENQIKFNIGRCYEMNNDIENARNSYNVLIQQAQGGQDQSSIVWAREAQFRLQMLDKKARLGG